MILKAGLCEEPGFPVNYRLNFFNFNNFFNFFSFFNFMYLLLGHRAAVAAA